MASSILFANPGDSRPSPSSLRGHCLAQSARGLPQSSIEALGGMPSYWRIATRAHLKRALARFVRLNPTVATRTLAKALHRAVPVWQLLPIESAEGNSNPTTMQVAEAHTPGHCDRTMEAHGAHP
jgi:hypothetical protein